MPTRSKGTLILNKPKKKIICDRCRKNYLNGNQVCAFRHTFVNEALGDGSRIAMTLCEACLLQLAFEWEVPLIERKSSARKNAKKTNDGGVLVQHAPVHPGVFLLEVYLKPTQTSIVSAAKLIAVDLRWMRGFVAAKNKITRTIANKLAKHFGSSSASWLAMQAHFDGSVQRLKGVIPSPAKAVTLKEMDAAIRRTAAKSARPK